VGRGERRGGWAGGCGDEGGETRGFWGKDLAAVFGEGWAVEGKVGAGAGEGQVVGVSEEGAGA
jgi:hypothetical protein